MAYNADSIDTVCASLAEIAGVEPPIQAAPANKTVTEYAAKAFNGEKADRILMFNPDAVAEWIVHKYPYLVNEVTSLCDITVPLRSVMPSVTPVNFGTMYTGAQPEVHGIRAYVKPVIKIDTLFDAFLRAGKKCAILADTGSSLSKIYLEREMDYFIYDTIDEILAKAAELIMEDKYDLLVVYQTNYDETMHKFGPEGIESLSELKTNSHGFAELYALVNRYWKKHNAFMGFSTDHGCHEIDGGCGSHGLEMEEDLNILHFFKALPKEN